MQRITRRRYSSNGVLLTVIRIAECMWQRRGSRAKVWGNLFKRCSRIHGSFAPIPDSFGSRYSLSWVARSRKNRTAPKFLDLSHKLLHLLFPKFLFVLGNAAGLERSWLRVKLQCGTFSLTCSLILFML